MPEYQPIVAAESTAVAKEESMQALCDAVLMMLARIDGRLQEQTATLKALAAHPQERS